MIQGTKGNEFVRITSSTEKLIGFCDNLGYKITIGKESYQLELKEETDQYSGKIFKDSTEFQLSKLKVGGHYGSWQVKWDSTAAPSRFTGHILNNKMEGTAHDLKLSWNALRTGRFEAKEEEKESETRSELSLFYPEGTYGWENKVLKDQVVLIQNTTIWTSGNQGILEDYDILFSNGRVKKIEKNINPPKDVMVIDGTGK